MGGDAVYSARVLLDMDVMDYDMEYRTDGSNELQMANRNPFVKVYPNPVKNDMVIDLLSDFEELITLSIYDLKGTLVHQELVSETTSFINLNKLNSGTYIYKIYTDTAILHQDKLVKLPNN